MNKLKLKHKHNHCNLEAALDDCVAAAIAQGVSQADLVAKLVNRYPEKIVLLKSERGHSEGKTVVRPMYNPIAGP